MKIPRLFSLIVLLALAASACSPRSTPAVIQETPVLVSTRSPAATPVEPTASADPVSIVISLLAEQLKIDPGEITVSDKEPVEWPNGCVGLPRMGEMCNQLVTPGFKITLMANQETFIFHSNLSGDIIRQEPSAQPTRENMPAAAGKAVQWLAQQTGVSTDQIQIARIEKVDWPDACLGVMKTGVVCAAVITPGYRITLQTADKTVEVHTNDDGSSIVQAQAVQPQTTPAVMTWELQGENCQTAQFSSIGVQYGYCKGDQKTASFVDPQRAAELKMLEQSYQSFTADTKAGKITFTGKGSQAATAAEQRSLAEWARMVALEASGGQGGAAYGLAFSWHRSGGIAGFCDDLSVSLTGFATASTCKGQKPSNLGFGRLKADQLEQVYSWVDSLKPFEINQSDSPTAADAMSLKVAFVGSGSADASEQDRQALLSLGADVYTTLQKPAQ
jgi:hypothetical protein